MVLGFGFIDYALPYAVAAMIFGAVLLIASLHSSREWIVRTPPSSSSLPGLYVAVEFIVGAYFVFLGIINQLHDLKAFDLGLTLVSALGVVLVANSLLLYKKGFRESGTS